MGTEAYIVCSESVDEIWVENWYEEVVRYIPEAVFNNMADAESYCDKYHDYGDAAISVVPFNPDKNCIGDSPEKLSEIRAKRKLSQSNNRSVFKAIGF